MILLYPMDDLTLQETTLNQFTRIHEVMTTYLKKMYVIASKKLKQD